jgi:hypothetical protein
MLLCHGREGSKGLPVRVWSHSGSHRIWRVVSPRDSRESSDAGIERGKPQRVTAAQADANGSDALRIDLLASAQVRDCRAQVGELALGALVATRFSG